MDRLIAENENNTDGLSPGLSHQTENTIYGQKLFNFYYKVPYGYEGTENEKTIKEDAEIIPKNNSVYLFNSYDTASGIPMLIDVLERYGTVEVVVNSQIHFYIFL